MKTCLGSSQASQLATWHAGRTFDSQPPGVRDYRNEFEIPHVHVDSPIIPLNTAVLVTLRPRPPRALHHSRGVDVGRLVLGAILGKGTASAVPQTRNTLTGFSR